jgi:16S rRNA (adenine1518-N6/adenine1519-N6)-dimethyltransferase
MTEPHRAKKSLGQNFLTDSSLQQRIVAAIDAQSDDVIVEIGPGQGALTNHLAGTVRKLILVELDDDLAAALQRKYSGRDDVDIIHADFLTLDMCEIVRSKYGSQRFKVIGNIPYNITTPIIFKLLERGCRPDAIVLMVQRELADRVISPPGSRTYGALSVGMQALAEASKLFHVGRGSFRPVPNVDSAVIRIVPHDPVRLTAEEERDLRALTRTSFGWRRKQMQKILRSAPAYELEAQDVAAAEQMTGIAMTQRPETLSPLQFIALARVLRAQGRPSIPDSQTSVDTTEWE